jgi:hypothetical protein
LASGRPGVPLSVPSEKRGICDLSLVDNGPLTSLAFCSDRTGFSGPTRFAAPRFSLEIRIKTRRGLFLQRQVPITIGTSITILSKSPGINEASS